MRRRSAKKGLLRSTEQVKPKANCPYTCWEEADYADECRLSTVFINRGSKKEDCYVDFFDVERD